jgi:uncharacterized protein YbjT (DUF2867 family)
MFAVAGASGRTGAATAEALLKHGEKVRVVVRKEEQGEVWQRRHAEVALADFNDTEALTRAFTGMKGVFVLMPPNPGATDFVAECDALFKHVTAAIKAANVKRVVLLSSVGAQHPTGTGPVVVLHNAEKALRNVAPSLTFVRPAYFVENWAQVALTALDTGELPFFGATHLKFPQACAKDIGEVCAKALTEDVHGPAKIIELCGKENWSAEDVAEVFASLFERKVKAVAHPVEQAKAGLMAAGVPEHFAGLMQELYQAHARGLLAFSHPHQLTRGHTSLYDALKPLV